ncbi:MAG: AAC(3) family N-acetyltransferase [Bacteriovoracaceae bacterium]|nr:AAC(3) family N-acetyltransferase [Bacteriovoracaceae bacterium]
MKRQIVGFNEIVRGLHAVGITKGDVVMLHADTVVLAQIPSISLEERLDILLESIKEVLGKAGTLVVPTFTYSFCRSEVYDVNDSPSKDVGAFPEYVRKRPEAKRSLDPIFSVAAIGSSAQELCEVELKDCFGQGSFFGKLHKMNAKIVCLGCSLDRATFIHYCEKAHGIDYRYNKTFSGEIIDKSGVLRECSIQYFVRDYSYKFTTDLTMLKERLKEQNKFSIGEIGRFGIYGTTAVDFFNETQAILDEFPNGLVKQDLALI